MDEKNITEELVDLSEEDVVYSEMKVEESSNPFVLGTMEGIFMVIEDDNGNGRWYQKETINEGIINNDYVKRMLECKALLGESHHPLDRTSIWSDEACICTRELWVDSTGKYLMGRADILDTPKGRIVYTLAKYGTKLGVSARANGKGVKQSGHLVIKPEHYFFKTFDVVLNPGFKEARPNLFEPDGRTPLRVFEEQEDVENLMFEELHNMVTKKSCDTKMLKGYIEYCDSDKLKELIPLMEDVSTEPSEGDTSTSSEIEGLNEEIASLRTQIQNYEKQTNSFDVYKLNTESEIAEIRAINEELLSTSEELKATIVKLSENNDADKLVEELLDMVACKEKELSQCRKIITLYEEHSSELETDKNNLYEENSELTKEIISLSESLSEFGEIIENLDEEEVVEETPIEVKPQKLFDKKVDLFSSGYQAMNEEETIGKSEISVSNGRINMIKSLGGK